MNVKSLLENLLVPASTAPLYETYKIVSIVLIVLMGVAALAATREFAGNRRARRFERNLLRKEQRTLDGSKAETCDLYLFGYFGRICRGILYSSIRRNLDLRLNKKHFLMRAAR